MWGGGSTPIPPLGPTAPVRGLEWWTRMEKNVAKQNISDAIIITPYAQNKIPSKRFALKEKKIKKITPNIFSFFSETHREGQFLTNCDISSRQFPFFF